MWSRIHLIPLLQAEEDRDLVRKHLADKGREKALLGSETSAYNGDRYAIVLYGARYPFSNLPIYLSLVKLTVATRRFVRPTFAVSPQNTTK